MINSLNKSRRNIFIKEIVNQVIDSILLSEQQVAPPQVSDPMMMADPNAATPTDPTSGMDMGLAPTDPTALPNEDGETEEDLDATEGGEEAIPEDPAQGVADKVKEEMGTDMTQNTDTLTSLAKSYLQDYGLLTPDKLKDAKSVIDKLRSENIPELNKVANSLEKFLA